MLLVFSGGIKQFIVTLEINCYHLRPHLAGPLQFILLPGVPEHRMASVIYPVQKAGSLVK